MMKIELLKTQLLPDFPSGSSINYREGLLYLIGDDANTILVLDKDYNRVSSFQLFNYAEKRIPKPIKTDLEASVLIKLDGQDHLLVFGSSSTKQREKVILIPFTQSGLDIVQALTISIEIFIDRLNIQGISEVNIEGATIVNETLVISNRGNRKSSTNHLIVTSIDFWKSQSSADIGIIPVTLSSQTDEVSGISEICYVKETDELFIACSSEHTDNAYDDGVIGNSYLSCIHTISQKIKTTSLTVDQMINLTNVHKDFKEEKIEGLCIESFAKDEMIAHLISDNDQGTSKLFRVRIKME